MRTIAEISAANPYAPMERLAWWYGWGSREYYAITIRLTWAVHRVAAIERALDAALAVPAAFETAREERLRDGKSVENMHFANWQQRARDEYEAALESFSAVQNELDQIAILHWIAALAEDAREEAAAYGAEAA